MTGTLNKKSGYSYPSSGLSWIDASYASICGLQAWRALLKYRLLIPPLLKYSHFTLPYVTARSQRARIEIGCGWRSVQYATHRNTLLCTYTRHSLPALELACKRAHTHTLSLSRHAWAAGTTRWRTDALPLVWPVAVVTQWGPTNGCSLWGGGGDGFGWHPKLSTAYSPPTFENIPVKLWQLRRCNRLVVCFLLLHAELGDIPQLARANFLRQGYYQENQGSDCLKTL